ncbi:MAG: hypothetical protein KAH57_06450 [Thermoplasmata archaeon]|nr:hypothetical protein [Thermoplasmata archaeon]
MNTRTILDNDRGDAVIVTTVLLMSIALSFGGSMLMDYGEVVGKDDEMTHVASIQDSLIRLRTSMYSLLESEDTSATIITRVSLGTYGNPYLAVSRASGTLTIDPTNEHFSVSILLRDTISGTETELNSVKGCISYETSNYYFHDQQYRFQGGAIILNEYQGTTMTSYPGLSLSSFEGDWGIDMELYGLTSSGQVISGFESIPLLVTMDGYSSINHDMDANEEILIRINGDGEEAWSLFYRTKMVEAGLTEGVDYDITDPLDWNDPDQYVEIELKTLTSFGAQIGEMEVRY